MRKEPNEKPPDINAIKHTQLANIIVQKRTYQLITPLFGGGVEKRENDPLTLIRGTEIRGQLRFWWRACRGGAYADLNAMKEAEDKIWGKANRKDDPKAKYQPVQITIDIDLKQKGTSTKPFKKEGRRVTAINGIPGYAAFPLQPEKNETYIPSVQSDTWFTLTIAFPNDNEYQKEIEAALWAWETFGGIGARTRRGFGALKFQAGISQKRGNDPENLQQELPLPAKEKCLEWLQVNLAKHVVSGNWPENVPHLLRERSRLKLPGAPASNALIVWKNIIELLRNFRQTRQGNSRTRPNYGRSLWPEASAIRNLTGQHLPKHQEPIPKPLMKKFPRAAFGLPINFKFRDDDTDTRQPNRSDKDPRKTVLQPQDSQRLASPLILKPLACQDNKYIGLAAILEGTGIKKEKLLLKTQEGKPEEWKNLEATLEKGQALRLINFLPINSINDALQTFFNSL